MMWWWNDGWSMPWVFGPFMMIMFVVVAVMFFMMRGMVGSGRSDNNAIDILKERFARGEITEAEY
jgi:putative membrane protein